LLSENIGPYQLTGDKFTYNEYAWTNKYNVLIIDNPVGTGWSISDDRSECYSSTQEEVAANIYVVLDSFFNDLHPEYATNPFFLLGESYAGKYIPNIAVYLDEKKFPFAGVIIGNGYYDAKVQYLTVPEVAYNFGIIDERSYVNFTGVAQKCANLIIDGKNNIEAENYCENMVSWIYDDFGGGVYRFDLRVYYDIVGDIDTRLSNYLNSADVKSALHTTGAHWTDSNEHVYDALSEEIVSSVLPKLEILLDRNYRVILYNGQMDGTACNHVSNANILRNIQWSGRDQFSNTPPKLWRLSDKNVIGYVRVYKNLAYVIIANSGHLVPMSQPENFRVFLDAAVEGGLA